MSIFRNTNFPSPQSYGDWKKWAAAFGLWLKGAAEVPQSEDPVYVPKYTTTTLPNPAQWECGVVLNNSIYPYAALQFSDGTAWRDITAYSITGTTFVFVKVKEDLPAASSGVITLAANTCYYFVTTVDLTGDRLVASANTTIFGAGSEIALIKSTGLSASTALLSSAWTLPVQNVSFSHGTALDLDAGANANQVLDWRGVNFVNCATIGTITDYENIIFTSMAWSSSANLIIDGTVATVSFDKCLLIAGGTDTALTLASTAVVTRRFRLYKSAVVTTAAGATGINVSTSATIPVESYILDDINFSGSGTPLAGVFGADNKAFFTRCTGVNNSNQFGHMYMRDNATATTIVAKDTPVKVAGTTTEGSQTERFTHASNRLTYEGAITRKFAVTVTVSFSSGTNNVIGVYLAKNGTEIDESEAEATANSSGRLENVALLCPVELAKDDYLEIWVENRSAVHDVTVDSLAVMVLAKT